VTNDGAVNAADMADPNGIDAQRTANPNDYTLVRQVYGDSVGNVAGNNGGVLQRVALVQKPGGSVPPMFQVYLEGQSTPWTDQRPASRQQTVQISRSGGGGGGQQQARQARPVRADQADQRSARCATRPTTAGRCTGSTAT
jgi:hypothetical protein